VKISRIFKEHVAHARSVILSDRNVIVVGQAPGRGIGQIGDRTPRGTWKHLAELFGVRYEDLDSIVGRFNLCPKYAGKNGEGDAFNAKLGKKIAREIYFYLWEKTTPATVIFLGKNVAKSFGVNCDFAKITSGPNRLKFAVVPHPSMRNRFWNDEKNVRMIKRFLRRIISNT
jgi:hypothetical protein